MENLMSLDRKRAIEELEKGRELATQLRRVIQGDNTTPFAQDLADKVERSFSNSLLLLNLAVADHNDVVSKFHHQQQQHLTDSSCRLPAKSDDSEDSCKSTLALHHNNKERRGCYKRRRTSQSWEMDSESPIEDGHAWRKYGQKTIMNAKYPRSYFRCTHKFDQECQATKQVQRIQEEPMMYKTIYYGNHTCNRNLLNPEIILDSEESPSTIDHHHHHHSSIILSFDNNNNVSLSSSTSSKQSLHLPFLSPSSTSSIINNDGSFTRQECKEEIPSPSLEDNKNNINHHEEEEEEYLISEHDAVIIPHELYDSVDFTSDNVFETFGF